MGVEYSKVVKVTNSKTSPRTSKARQASKEGNWCTCFSILDTADEKLRCQNNWLQQKRQQINIWGSKQ
jgi:hypothetical protein